MTAHSPPSTTAPRPTQQDNKTTTVILRAVAESMPAPGTTVQKPALDDGTKPTQDDSTKTHAASQKNTLRHSARSRRIHSEMQNDNNASRKATDEVTAVSKAAYVYILASQRHGTLYTGVTTDLARRMREHKLHLMPGFTQRYDVTRLVWFEHGDDISAAIALEKKSRAGIEVGRSP